MTPRCRFGYELSESSVQRWCRVCRNKRSRLYRRKLYDPAKRHKEYERFKDSYPIYVQNRRVRIAQNGGKLSKEQWEKLCKKYGYRCLACGEKRKLTVDHVVPLLLGGSGSIGNIQPLCGPCNSSKRDKIIDYRKQYA